MAIRTVIAVLLLCADLLAASPPTDVDWLTTFEAAPGVHVGVWSIVDSHAVWPSALDPMARKLYDAGRLESYRYIFKNKGDYLRVVVYVKDGSRWKLTANTRVVFCYPKREIGTLEILFPSADGRAVLGSRSGVVVGSAGAAGMFMRSTDGGYRAYLRFAPGSLPRPVRRWFRGGNRWGVMPPESVEVQEGGSR